MEKNIVNSDHATLIYPQIDFDTKSFIKNLNQLISICLVNQTTHRLQDEINQMRVALSFNSRIYHSLLK